MGDDYLFELPIYTSKEDAFYQDFDKKVEKLFHSWTVGSGAAPSRHHAAWLTEQIRQEKPRLLPSFGGPWRYNQICGFLGVYALGNQLRGALWYPGGKIFKKSLRKRTVDWYGKAFELTVEPEVSSAVIFLDLLYKIEALRRERPLKGRYIDVRSLMLVGRFIDWKNLMQISSSRGIRGLRLEDFWPNLG